MAKGKEWRKCGRLNHFQSNFWSTTRAVKGIIVPESPSIAVGTSDLVSIWVTLQENQKNNVTLLALPDMGAEIDAILKEIDNVHILANAIQEQGKAQ